MSLKATRTVLGVDAVSPVYTKVEAEGADFLPYFKSHFKIDVISESDEELVFDMVGVDAAFANALRRILLAEVPSVAIEHVYIANNTSIVQDEILSHRLGLVPLNVDPRLIETLEPGGDATDLNTLVFRMSVKGKSASSSSGDIEAGLEGDEDNTQGPYTNVYASQLVWEPQGGQEEALPVRAAPVNGDILLAKLAPGQAIELEAHAVKGVGKDHAKFSPVCTAAYRNMPKISLSTEKPFVGAEADALVAACPKNVFDIEDLGSQRSAYVARPRECTACRECIRPTQWTDRVTVERILDHFIFSIESVGAMPARAIFQEAIKLLVAKARGLLDTMGVSSDGTSSSSSSAASAIPRAPTSGPRVPGADAVMKSADDDQG